MTAEVAVLNTSAVALAADSAATIDVERAKVLRTADKLFMLSKAEPVGIMIYGHADLNGLPWETIVKSFRADLGFEALPRLTDYGDRMFEWLLAHERLFTAERRDEAFVHAMGRWTLALRDSIKRQVDFYQQQDRVPGAPVDPQAVAEEVVDAALGELRAAPRVDVVPPRLASAYGKRYRGAIDVIVDKVLGAEFDTARIRQRLRTLPGLLASRADEGGAWSGVVLAGFGRDEFLPSLVEYQVYGVHDVFVRRLEQKRLSVQAPRGAAIVPFAQSEMVETFLNGLGPGLRYVLDESFDALAERLPELIAAVVGEPLDAAADERARAAAQALRDTLSGRLDRETDAHSSPIVSTVSVLPKDELAAMAESLVNLTRFKRRVSLNEVETVAGDIDVAVISKGDGFVWIKRKHYFEMDRNPHWRANYWHDSAESAG